MKRKYFFPNVNIFGQISPTECIILPIFDLDATPFFFKNMPLNDNNFSLIYFWPVFFFFNIFGEEFYWRGYIQPRQEILNKKWTWLVHGLLWAFWHFPMGETIRLEWARRRVHGFHEQET